MRAHDELDAEAPAALRREVLATLGEAAWRQRAWPDAIRAYRGLVEGGAPDDAGAFRYRLAVAADRTGEPALALATLTPLVANPEIARAVGPDQRALALRLYADLAEGAGDEGGAAAALESFAALAVDGSATARADAIYRAGELFRRAERTDDAIRCLEATLRISETHLPALDALEAAWRERGDLERVAVILGRKVAATARHPGRQKPLLSRLGDLQAQLGRPDVALATHQRALEIDAAWRPSLRFVTLGLRDLGQLVAAAGGLAQLAGDLPGDPGVDIAVVARERQLAASELARLVGQLEPAQVEAVRVVALAALERAALDVPTRGEGLEASEIAAALEQLRGQPADRPGATGITDITDITDIADKDTASGRVSSAGTTARSLRDAAARARAAGKLDDALATLETANHVAPGDPALLRDLAELATQLGDHPAAARHLEELAGQLTGARRGDALRELADVRYDRLDEHAAGRAAMRAAADAFGAGARGDATLRLLAAEASAHLAWAVAVEALSAISHDRRTSTDVLQLATALRRAGRDADALELVEDATRRGFEDGGELLAQLRADAARKAALAHSLELRAEAAPPAEAADLRAEAADLRAALVATRSTEDDWELDLPTRNYDDGEIAPRGGTGDVGGEEAAFADRAPEPELGAATVAVDRDAGNVEGTRNTDAGATASNVGEERSETSDSPAADESAVTEPATMSLFATETTRAADIDSLAVDSTTETDSTTTETDSTEAANHASGDASDTPLATAETDSTGAMRDSSTTDASSDSPTTHATSDSPTTDSTSDSPLSVETDSTEITSGVSATNLLTADAVNDSPLAATETDSSAIESASSDSRTTDAASNSAFVADEPDSTEITSDSSTDSPTADDTSDSPLAAEPDSTEITSDAATTDAPIADASSDSPLATAETDSTEITSDASTSDSSTADSPTADAASGSPFAAAEAGSTEITSDAVTTDSPTADTSSDSPFVADGLSATPAAPAPAEPALTWLADSPDETDDNDPDALPRTKTRPGIGAAEKAPAPSEPARQPAIGRIRLITIPARTTTSEHAAVSPPPVDEAPDDLELPVEPAPTTRSGQIALFPPPPEPIREAVHGAEPTRPSVIISGTPAETAFALAAAAAAASRPRLLAARREQPDDPSVLLAVLAHLGDGEPELRRSVLDEAAETSRGTARAIALHHLGLDARADGDPARATALWTRAYEADPSYPPIWILLADSLAASDDRATARELYEKIAASDAYDAERRAFAADRADALGHDDAVVSGEIAPEQLRAAELARATELADAGDLPAAIAAAERAAIAAPPDDAHALELLEKLYLESGDITAASEAIGRQLVGVEDETRRATLWRRRARLYRDALGRDAEAYRCLKEAQACSPADPEVAYQLRVAAMVRGEWALAASLLYREIAAAANPRDRGALHLELALIYEERLEDGAQAQVNYEQALAFDPTIPAAKLPLARRYAAIGRHSEAARLYEDAATTARAGDRAALLESAARARTAAIESSSEPDHAIQLDRAAAIGDLDAAHDLAHHLWRAEPGHP
ncbi:MAG: hypothetical protein ACTHU0_37600, partial [Kofleriaceae bacterium]